MKFVLGALTAIALFVGVAAAQPAEARCHWNGYAMRCWHAQSWWGHHHHHYWRGDRY